MLQREVSDSTWKERKQRKRTTSRSTDGGYRSVAPLNGRRAATGKKRNTGKDKRTLAKLQSIMKKK